MIFTKSQIDILVPALRTYDLFPRGVLTPEVQHGVASSALRKLTASDNTAFTKQEYTIMAMAVQFEIVRLESSSAKVPAELVVLRGQLFALALPY